MSLFANGLGHCVPFALSMCLEIQCPTCYFDAGAVERPEEGQDKARLLVLYCTVLYCTVLYLYAWKLFYGLLERGGLVQQMGENLQYQYWQAETPAPYSSIVETR
jgi:hypothetical protein